VIEQRAAVLDKVREEPLHGQFSERRGLVEIADDHSAQHPQIIDVLLNGFGRQIEEARCSRNGRKQVTSFSPAGRSFSHPIHERGQPSRSGQ